MGGGRGGGGRNLGRASDGCNANQLKTQVIGLKKAAKCSPSEKLQLELRIGKRTYNSDGSFVCFDLD